MGWRWAIGAAALALLLLTYFYRARTARPRLVYQQRALSLIADTDGELKSEFEIHYHGRDCHRITKTYLVMWNVGRLIRSSDLSSDDPLRFEVSGDGQILTAEVIKASTRSNVSASQAQAGALNAAAIFFDELGPGEGVVIEVLHTSAERFGVLKGSIKGMPGPAKDRGRIRHPFNPLPSQVPTSFKAIGSTALVLTFGIGALLVLLSAFGSSLAPLFGPHVGPAMSVIEGVSDVIYAGLALALIVQMRRRFPEDLAIPALVD